MPPSSNQHSAPRPLRIGPLSMGWAAIIILCALPVLQWVAMQPLAGRFTGSFGILTSLGNLTAIVGTVLYCLSMILSARLKIFDDIFDGLNRAYVAHHITGAIGLVLLVLHPLLLASRSLSTSLSSTISFLLPANGGLNFNSYAWAVNYGIIALVATCLLLVVTFWMIFPYEIWLLTHKFLGWAFAFVCLHILFIPSDITRDFPLKLYLIVLLVIGLIAFGYRTLLGKILVRRYRYVVDGLKMLDANIFEIYMHPISRGMSFQPGQFVFISFEQEDLEETHPFSISSPPESQELSLTVKLLGEYTRDLTRLRPGTVALVEGAFGAFSYRNYRNPRQIWIAGGIGITPFISMAESLHPSTERIDLYYCVNHFQELIDIQQLFSVRMTNPPGEFNVIPFVADKNGRITAAYVAEHSTGVGGAEIFLCGPLAMMSSLRQQFRELGVPNRMIHSEEFNIL